VNRYQLPWRDGAPVSFRSHGTRARAAISPTVMQDPGSRRLLGGALTETVGVLLPGALTAEYTVVATLLGPLAPTAGSHPEVLLRMGLVIASVTGVGVLIAELAWLVDRGHRQRPQTWICSACSAGNHQQCRGALLLVARTSEGARPCQCEHCMLNR
jgi:hypothetical protein